ncbi:hypothetical protein, variant 2 [Aphanomyces astaci]|uniref:Uncharacterized protein n=1 Tax=Aphanomyces astaci TaxID=112090 RepID=W4GF15_APHAT|nr:hypothetical protein, variant 2 [Aphanomyces astaci]ETV77543.1 hypothetical protein, variant 2 [Aphanomyces astaci]|eukprot:XP_009832653.1 hypothetical protein, variant 2 [Aphanomyces astaci]
MGTTISLAATRPIVVTLNGVNMITKLKDCRKLYLANLSHGILTRYTWETFKVIVWRNFDIKSSLIQGEYPSRMRCHRQSMHTCLPQSPRTLQSIRHQLWYVKTTVDELHIVQLKSCDCTRNTDTPCNMCRQLSVSLLHHVWEASVSVVMLSSRTTISVFKDDYSNGSTTAGLCFLPYFRSLQNPCMC